MDEKGLLVCDSGHRYTKQKRFRDAGRRVYCVCIDNEALQGFLDRTSADGAAVIASQGGVPC